MKEKCDLSLELSKILAKTMQNSYKRKEVEETVRRIIEKIEKMNSKEHDEERLRTLRRQFEEIRQSLYEL